MSDSTAAEKLGRAAGNSGIKKRIIPLSTLILIIVISILLFIYGRNLERIAELEKYSYMGAFLISLIGNASVLLPGIVLPALTTLGIHFYHASGELLGPILIGMAGGAGAAIGEIVGYMAGYSGRNVIRNKTRYEKLGNWVRRWGTLAIFVFTLAPLFFDLVGIVAGAMRFPLWKFILICWIGRTILYAGIIVLAMQGWKVLLPYF